MKRTPKEEPEEREALEQDTQKAGRQKVKVEGPSSQSLAPLDYSQGTGIENLSRLTQHSLSRQSRVLTSGTSYHTGLFQYVFPSSLSPFPIFHLYPSILGNSKAKVYKNPVEKEMGLLLSSVTCSFHSDEAFPGTIAPLAKQPATEV